ncbi:MAG TPA: hypothetical protein DDX75_03155, partial [Phycisphaerales bacterium]|nr:hypothetical protein [Phycisphaerales bacterium]
APDYNTYADVDVYDYDPATDTISSHTRTPTSLTRFIIAKSTDYYNHGLDAFGIRNNYRDEALNMNYKFDNFYFSTECPLLTPPPPPYRMSSEGTIYYYAAPTVYGDGSGSSPENAMDYLSSTFWSNVNNILNTNDVQIIFLDGIYGSELEWLDLWAKGNPMHKLTLVARNRHAAVFDAVTSHYITLQACCNFDIDGFKFAGEVAGFAVSMIKGGKKGSRDIEIRNCIFQSHGKGPLGILDGNRNITVRNCDFRNCGGFGEPHMIYSDHDTRDILIKDCNFIDLLGSDWVRFRDDCDYATVDGCKFHSTNSDYNINKEFILIPLFNDVNPGNEFFGTNFQITNNIFRYDTPGGRRHAVQIRCDGWNVPGFDGLDYWIDPSEADILNYGTVEQKCSILEPEMGLKRDRFIMYNNSFFGIDNEVVYWHFPNAGSGNQGYTGYCDISDWPTHCGVRPKAPPLINGNFEIQGNCFRAWHKLSDSNSVRHQGLNGTATSVISRKIAPVQEMYQYVNNAKSIWAMECLFAVGQFTGTGIIFRVDIGHNEITDSTVSIGVNNFGQIGIYNGSSFIIIPELGTIEFSSDTNNDGDYSNTGDTLRVYRLRIAGDYSTSSPNVKMSMSNENMMTFSRFSISQSYWVNGTPASGAKPSLVNFCSANCAAIVDEVNFSQANPADCLSDGIVGFGDLSKLAGNWLAAGLDLDCDLKKDLIINFEDFAMLAQNWSLSTDNP